MAEHWGQWVLVLAGITGAAGLDLDDSLDDSFYTYSLDECGHHFSEFCNFNLLLLIISDNIIIGNPDS